jgi:hypothetical protein
MKEVHFGKEPNYDFTLLHAKQHWNVAVKSGYYTKKNVDI